MSKYHLYGIGNALVDMEFELSFDQLEALQIDKGVMTLIDQGQHDALYAELSGLPTKRSCGGSAANTVIALAQLGGQSYYSCKVASDETGDFYLADMTATGVDTNLSQQTREDGITGKCVVMTSPDTDRSMNTFLGITADIGPGELDASALSAAEFYYMEGYLVASPTGQAAAIEGRGIAEATGVKTVLTLSDPNMVNFFRDGLLAMAGDKLDLLFCNHDEALAMSKTDSPEAAMGVLRELAKAVVITNGPKGSTCFDGQDLHTIEAVHAEAVDSNGAGDMYAGAFLYGLSHGMDHATAGALASLCASKIVSQFGPRLKVEQTQALLKQFTGA